jgi:lipoprotein-anchoring transpeptidase ErfK/SrfK
LQNAQIRSEGIVPELFQTSLFSRRLPALAIIAAAGAIVIASLGAATPASAQIFGYETSKPQPKKRAAARRHTAPRDDTAVTAKVAKTKEAKEAQEAKKDGKKDGKKEAAKDAKPAPPTDPVYVVISIADQHISVYDANGAIAHSRVSTGMPGHPTPVGLFSVIGKERWHRSNIYSGAPMPWMQRITWSGVAMHLGVVPGYPASHGCIRLPAAFAPQLWNMTKMGARVVVARRDTVPFEIANAFLPLPKMQPAPGTQQASNVPATAPIELASMSPQAGGPIATAAVQDAPPAAAPASTPKLLNPMEYAAALKQHAAADKAASEKAAKDSLAAAQAAGVEARQAVDDVRKAVADVKTAELKIAELDAAAAAAKQAADAAAPSAQGAQAAADPASTPAPATTPITTQATVTTDATTPPVASPIPAKPPAPTTTQALGASQGEAATAVARTAAEAELTRARTALDEANHREAEKSTAAFAAVQVYKAAVAASEAAAETLIEAGRRVEPVSVMISKKEGRVFIRQDWKDVYEAPVTFKDPDRPMGTHLFIAVAAQPDGSSMRWSAITAPESSSGDGDRKRSKKGAEDAPPPPTGPASTAAEALDRIEMAPEARQRIAELLWTGGSLIVTDHARSDEMDSDTDFIVSTR